MIQTFKDDVTEAIFKGERPREAPSTVINRAKLKLESINAASDVMDLKNPPGNRLHKLTADREGQWSISVNDQYRICFRWGESGPEDVEFTDYH